MTLCHRAAVVFALCCIAAFPAGAEQSRTFGAYEVHYIVVPTTFLKADIAARYDITRSRNRALVNVSVLDANDAPITAGLSGRSENLLGQSQVLEFKEIREGPAIYYLALLRHGDEEFHRVAIDVTLPDGSSGEIRFQQQMFFEE